MKTAFDHHTGVVALMQYLDKPIPKPETGKFPREKLRTGDSILLFNTTNVKERIKKIEQLGLKMYA